MNTYLSPEKSNAIDITDILTRGFELFKKYPGKLCLLSLVAMLVSLFSIFILGGVMLMNFLAIVKRLDNSIEGSYDPEISDLFQRLDRFVDAFVLGLIIVGVNVVLLVVTYILGISGTIIGSLVISTISTPFWLLSFQILNEEDGINVFEIVKSVFEFIKTSPIKVFGLGACLGVLTAVPSLLGGLLNFIVLIAVFPITLCIGRTYFKAVTQ